MTYLRPLFLIWVGLSLVLSGCPTADDGDTGDDDSSGDDDDSSGDDDDSSGDDDDSSGDDDATGDDDDTVATGILLGQTLFVEGDGLPGPAPGAEVTATALDGTEFGPVVSQPQTANYEIELPGGEYSVVGTYQGFDACETGVVVAEGQSVELDLLIASDADAPYIYLYPETTEQVGVTLQLSPYTDILASMPPYAGGWDVEAEPSGLLDGIYPYLFYEAGVPWLFQTAEGWAVESALVWDWFETMLPAMGLSTSEADDFLDFWTVHLPPAACYQIYPQPEPVIDQAVGLTISPAPDSLLRLWLVIEGVPVCGAPAEPVVEPFVRSGFTAVEWGVVLDAGTF